MGQTLTPQQVLTERVRSIRKRHNWTAQDLSDRVADLGGNLGRGAIAKIENGQRDVKLDEAMLLALALDVSPKYLFLPVREGVSVALAPAMEVDASTARLFFSGIAPLPGQDPYVFRTEVNEELVKDREFWGMAEKAERQAEQVMNDPNATDEELRRVGMALAAITYRMKQKLERDPRTSDIGGDSDLEVMQLAQELGFTPADQKDDR